MSISAATRLASLRNLLQYHKIAGYIVPTEDAHSSEYTHDADKRLKFISSFDGSAGTALITLNKAYLWTDGRYWNQASKQLDAEHWTLMKQGNHPGLSMWLAQSPYTYKYLHPESCDDVYAVLPSGALIGIDPKLMSTYAFRDLKSKLEKSEFTKYELVSVQGTNLVDTVWRELSYKPAQPQGEIFSLDERFAGESYYSKLTRMREEMSKQKCDFLVLTSLDEIAWLLNLRGSDIAYNPLFFSYVLLSKEKLYFYVDKSKFNKDAYDKLSADSSIEVLAYDAFLYPGELYSKIGSSAARVLVDVSTCNWAVMELLYQAGNHVSIVEKESPVKMAKTIKNNTEVQGMRNCHVRDGAALVKLFTWLEKQMADEKTRQEIDEVVVEKKLLELRKQQYNFVTPSFATISSSGPNAAVIHYHPNEEQKRKLNIDEIFLLDSGGQYLDGTTDVTRTVHFGVPTAHQRECFTRVLKGHIALDTAVFPSGVSGFKLDVIARLALWQVGLDYIHGTGHGVGAFLPVHEFPPAIGTRRKDADDYPLQINQILSNEPGYYENGNFGIRIENLVVVRDAQTRFKFNDKTYLGFEHITFVPICLRLIDVSLLTDAELTWVNEYHRECREKLTPLLYDDAAALAWLEENTKALSR